MANEIYFFTKNDPYYEFSNFSPYGFEEDALYWSTVEHYFQANKLPGTEQYLKIQRAHDPKQAKELGQSRKVPLRADWEKVKEAIMYHALTLKFAKPKLKERLLGTGTRILIENSPYDTYWGIGRYHEGKNRLGELLMRLRSELREEH